MTNNYIRRQDAVEALADYIMNVDKVYSTGKLTHDDCIDCAESVLNDLSSADVVQVVHGRWIDADSHLGYFANCSVCGYQMDVHAERGYFNFCPNCWAKMDAQREE